MQTIPLIDIRADGPRQLACHRRVQALDLIRATRHTLGVASNVISAAALPAADWLSRRWLVKTGNPYLDEIDYYARELGVPGIHALNVCFEWGCTSGVYEREDGPTLTRILDWPFPKMGENTLVALQSGAAGDFYNVTWPAASGMFQGMAPGRFAAALNQAPMRRHRLGYVGDWIKNRRDTFRATGLPPAHLLRRVFEQAPDYETAKKMLCETPAALPVIFILSGVKWKQGCVIERTEKEFAVRPLENARVCAANQFDTRLNETGHGWRPRPVDSAGRYRQAVALSPAQIDEHFRWFAPPIANSHTRLAVMANAGSGKLAVFGAFGTERVTEIFTLRP